MGDVEAETERRERDDRNDKYEDNKGVEREGDGDRDYERDRGRKSPSRDRDRGDSRERDRGDSRERDRDRRDDDRRERGRGERGRNGGRGGREGTSLLVRNLSKDISPDELRATFEKYGDIRDVYIPLDYYSREPKGFAFVEFLDGYDADDALHEMDRKEFRGRELTVVVAKQRRKTPHEMRRGGGGGRGRGRGRGRYRSRSRDRGRDRRRSYSRSRSRGRDRDRDRRRSYSRSYSR